jgi:hypothetical protein
MLTPHQSNLVSGQNQPQAVVSLRSRLLPTEMIMAASIICASRPRFKRDSPKGPLVEGLRDES